MTGVLGHLTNLEFPSEYKNWNHPPPESLFTAPVIISVNEVHASVPEASSPSRAYLSIGQEGHHQEH